MYKGKARYLEKLAPRFSVRFGKTIEGSSPPGVFVGRKNYPKVFVGPLVTEQKGDTTQLDMPERWMGKSVADISTFRMQLARGMRLVSVNDLDSKLAGQMRDIALSSKSIEASAEFLKQPRGCAFDEHHQPFGPSAPLKSIEISGVKYEHRMEKAYYDTDMDAKTALTTLYGKGLLISQLQKALSIGAFGAGKRRKLVPTRWSITAVDDTVCRSILDSIRSHPQIDCYQVYEFYAFNNYFAIMLTPTQWQYEFLEAFIGVLGSEELIFTDWEPYHGRSDYAGMGGCYYSTRLAIAEKLDSIKRQAGAIVFRESYRGYIPLGVWLTRESAREAMKSKPREFDTKESAIQYISEKLRLPFLRYRKNSVLLKQSNLFNYVK